MRKGLAHPPDSSAGARRHDRQSGTNMYLICSKCNINFHVLFSLVAKAWKTGAFFERRSARPPPAEGETASAALRIGDHAAPHTEPRMRHVMARRRVGQRHQWKRHLVAAAISRHDARAPYAHDVPGHAD